jgi:hypothetical protein
VAEQPDQGFSEQTFQKRKSPVKSMTGLELFTT